MGTGGSGGPLQFKDESFRSSLEIKKTRPVDTSRVRSCFGYVNRQHCGLLMRSSTAHGLLAVLWGLHALLLLLWLCLSANILKMGCWGEGGVHPKSRVALLVGTSSLNHLVVFCRGVPQGCVWLWVSGNVGRGKGRGVQFRR